MVLKQLSHWERFIVPRMIDVMARDGQYRVGSALFETAVEQVRHRLRSNDIRTATVDAAVLFDRDFENIKIPGKETDWSANILDECVVDTWVLAKLKRDRRKG